MSGVEIGIAVIGAVAALVTAYKDAGGIVAKIKERRNARGALPPSVALEESLDEGHQEIERITAKGIKRFGADFEQGDDIAHRALQSLTIEVQASLLRHLTLAVKDDSVTDFEACIDSAIEARLKAVTILNELYLRQQRRFSGQREPEDRVSRASTADTRESRDSRLSQKGQEESSLTLQSTPIPVSQATLPAPPMARKSSWNVFKNLHRATSREQTQEHSSSPPTKRTSSVHMEPPAGPLRATTTSSMSVGSWEDSPRPPMLTPPLSPVPTLSFQDAVAEAGFCTGATYAQQGIYEKSLRVSMKNMEWSCHCRKCPFTTPADRDEHGRPKFDDRIYQLSKLRFRTLFLFKSHLPATKQKKHLYKCLICALSGDSSPTYDGELHLFEHISHHQGASFGTVELSGPISLESTGVTVASEASFDICFPSARKSSLPPPKGAVELDGLEVWEADTPEITEVDDVFKNQWVGEGLR
ncbi:hypothetical protein HRR83_003926 [Exophiala dermatitidis]|uniref:Uncharacterized protein n=2 Tax=Exophiala dermatitidis TaxID=5970 RepID=H6BPY8_EXODN|nr:uncharacterized protein HMPREF1120_01896 [Exophiala dermatitidis NIH/UT8656]KAJ4518790.1 hypothetical protein HRR75_002463 [Exophiala dermatitidis]EHY53711.1 hypothetical protein HMPREF1120_01896 [Exophiala dermatitidis NIH/UT8656]KAJ4522109.1 hypothetical protein HRR74_002689 [Exophiala dermatitidis]KAJ4529435.1 hypothetical protein HRR73_000458 [Exophiala dermatitidis]KAJ4543909.1 hypothetical protein HRR76_001968 [Exophiala dermatitidis]